MPYTILSGPDVTRLMSGAVQQLGPDAVVVAIRRVRGIASRKFVLEAADPATAALLAPPSSRLAPARPLLPLATDGPAVIVLVGPTGSGKTTTIAKLANHPRVFGGRRVGLLTLDTYRVGGVEQSRLYAEISKLPLEVVYEDRELEPAVRRLRDCDVILVDTPGRSPTARKDRAALAERIRALRPFDVHLTLPAWLSLESARRVLAEHRAYGVNHLLATKVDEAPEATAPFDLALATGLPMAWYTDGQEVPADLKPAAVRLKTAGIAVAA